MKNVILLGPPGAGKGTQAKRLEAVLHTPHIASGDLLRDIRREKTPLAQEVQSYMDRGQYVPDDLMNRLFGGEVFPLFQHLIEDRGISDEDVRQLRDLLDRLEREEEAP